MAKLKKPRNDIGNFPVSYKTCPFFGLVDGKMVYANTIPQKQELLCDADEDVFAVWPGQWSSDIFCVTSVELK